MLYFGENHGKIPHKTDEAHQALYDIIRAAFLAGWRSAGGDPPQEQKLFELIPGGKPLEPPK